MADDRNGKYCPSCKYVDNNDIVKSCRRYPPTVLAETVRERDAYGNTATWEVITSHFPDVDDTDYCGEYKDRSAT